MSYLKDGYQTLISFSAVPAILLREREVQPLDLYGGEIDTTTMRNLRWRTCKPHGLVTGSETTLQVQYDPWVYTTLVNSLLGANNVIIIFFPDGSAVSFWGWINRFTPASHKEGEFPLAEVVIFCSNRDNEGNETDVRFIPPEVAAVVADAEADGVWQDIPPPPFREPRIGTPAFPAEPEVQMSPFAPIDVDPDALAIISVFGYGGVDAGAPGSFAPNLIGD